MHPLEKKIVAFIAEQQLLPRSGTVVVAVSGGSDSMALLQLLATLSDKLHVDTLVAVYVDHGLRPVEVEVERRIVRKSCERLGVACVIRQVDVAAERKKGKSLEHAARDQRYQALADVAVEVNATAIAVAHTADDQAEEVLLRLIRGTGRSGLSGMRCLRHGQVIRPLLHVPKAELVAYLQRQQVEWCEDSSNQDRVFLRNQVRLDILPFLEKYNPALRTTLHRTARILQDEEDFLESHCQELTERLVELDHDVLVVDVPGFVSQHTALQRRLIEAVFIRLHAQPSAEKVEQVLGLARSGTGNSQLHFGKGLRLHKKRGKLLFSYPQGRVAKRGNL